MFDQVDAPLRIIDSPMLGDPLFVLHQQLAEAADQEPPPEPLDHRVELLEGWVAVLEARIARLEQQTPRAYLRRGIAALKALWSRVWARWR